MSIYDHNDEEMVRLPGMWEVLHKIAIGLAIPVFLLGVSWAVWLTTTVWGHTTDLAVMRENVGVLKARAGLVAKAAARGAARMNEQQLQEDDE